jgi:hypothetical protein
MTPVTSQVRDRTAVGFMFDTVQIPMPIIRMVAVPRPPEMTMTMPMTMATPMTQMPMMGMPAAPMGMGGMGAGMQPMGNMNMNLQGSMNAQAAAAMVGAINNLPPERMRAVMEAMSGNPPSPQPPNQQRAPNPGGAWQSRPGDAVAAAPTGVSATALEEQLRQAEQKLRELEELRARLPKQ